MLPTNHYAIRPAAAGDHAALRRLAELAAKRPPSGRILIGELGGEPAAALSLTDGRVITDPSRRTGGLVAAMRLRGRVLTHFEAVPSLRERIAIGLTPAPAA